MITPQALTADSLALKLLATGSNLLFRGATQFVQMTPAAPLVTAVHMATHPLHLGKALIRFDPSVLKEIVPLSKRFARAAQTRSMVDVSRLTLTSRDGFVLHLVQSTGSYSDRALDKFLKTNRFNLSPGRLAELRSHLNDSATKLTQLTLLRQHVGWGGDFYFTRAVKIGQVDPIAIYHTLSDKQEVVRAITNRYGHFDQVTFKLHCTYHAHEHHLAHHFETYRQAADELRSRQLLAHDGHVFVPVHHPLDDIAGLHVTADPEAALFSSSSKIDQRIAEIIQTHGAFNRETFEAHLVIPQHTYSPGPTAEASPFTDRIRAARNANLVDYLESQGESLEHAGQGWFKIKGSGGVAVKGNAFCHLNEPNFMQGRPKNALEFVLWREQCTFPEAVDRLSGISPVSVGKPQTPSLPAPKLPIPEQTLHLVESSNIVCEYLTEHRHLDSKLVHELVDKKIIRQDQRGNVLFLGSDAQGQIRNVVKRSTHKSQPFKGLAKGSDRQYGFAFGEHGSNRLCVTESAIDAISLAELERKQGKTASYLSLNGLASNALDQYLRDYAEITEITIALDNDRGDVTSVKKGIETAATLANTYRAQGYKTDVLLPPEGKDWNEYLCIEKNQAPRSPIRRNTHQAHLESLLGAPSKDRVDVRSALEQQGWTEDKINASYLRHVRRLFGQANTDGLRICSPSLERAYADFAPKLLRPLSHKVPPESVDPFADVEIDFGRSKQFDDIKRYTFKHHELEFMRDLGRFGVADRSGWNDAIDRSFLHANYRDLVHDGDMTHFNTNLLARNHARQQSLGKLIRAGLVEQNRELMGREGHGYEKTFYTLTQKGLRLLTRLDGVRYPTGGSFKKKTSELFHDLKTFRLYQQERSRLLLEGHSIVSVKTDADLKSEAASELETLRRTMMQHAGCSKEELIELNRLKGHSSMSPGQTTRLNQLQKVHDLNIYSPKHHTQWQHLDKLHRAGALSDPDLKAEYARLSSLREKITQADPQLLKRYDKLSAQSLPDLQITYLETTITDQGDAITAQHTNTYEVDSGGGVSAQRGGYSRQEILQKLSHMDGQIIWATPGGLASAQGQKVAHLMAQTQTRGQVISI